MNFDEVREVLSRDATVPLLVAGKALGLTRNKTYQAAIDGEIEILQFGRLKRVPTAWLGKKLGLIS